MLAKSITIMYNIKHHICAYVAKAAVFRVQLTYMRIRIGDT